MIEIKIKIGDIDYGTAADTLLPVLMDKLSKSANPLTAILLDKIEGKSGAHAKGTLKCLPQNLKDDLAVACLNHYNEKISKTITDMAKEKGMNVQVYGVEATKK